MALQATIYNFDIELAHVDRGVYETLALRVAQHPSESEDFLVARVLAYCLEYGEGIAFSSGLSDPGEPAIAVRDLTGALRAWIDIGAPDAARLHRAAKAAARVAVYAHREPTQFLRRLAGETIHRADEIEIFELARPMLADLVSRLQRRMEFSLSVTDGDLMIAIGDEVIMGRADRRAIQA